MASTRNKNNYTDYRLQQSSYIHSNKYSLNPEYSISYDTTFAGNGLNPQKLPNDKLSKNPIDTESFLFGINSTNLVNPAPCFIPLTQNLKTTNLFETPNTIMPQPFINDTHQRPHFN
jgi:hypothetical protein